VSGFSPWLTLNIYRSRLDKALNTFESRYGTYQSKNREAFECNYKTSSNETAKPGTETSYQTSNSPNTRSLLTNASEEDRRDMEEELDDKSCGNPFGPDLHDEIIRPFFSARYTMLPPSYPARHMHIIKGTPWKAEDKVLCKASPRLCDGVATVLHNTDPKCLSAFLDPKNKVFEWRRTVQNVLIRRSGNEVLVRRRKSQM